MDRCQPMDATFQPSVYHGVALIIIKFEIICHKVEKPGWGNLGPRRKSEPELGEKGGERRLLDVRGVFRAVRNSENRRRHHVEGGLAENLAPVNRH